LSVLVFAHELGHFFTARWFGVKAEEFGLGFPPRGLGTYKNIHGKRRWVFGNIDVEDLEKSEDANLHPASKATVYSLNWLPMGGFVKIKGENGEGQNDKDSFAYQKIWKRIIILAAGVIMNIILAWALFSIGYMIGMPQSTDTVSKYAIVSEPKVIIAQVMTNSPAAAAGLKEGDAVLRINNQVVGTDKAFQDAMASNNGQATTLLIERASKEETLNVVPAAKNSGRATIGVAIIADGLVRYPFFPALVEGVKTTGYMIKEIVVAFANLFRDLFAGHNVGDQFAGPVGIATITGQAARLGFSYLLQFMALLSLNLAIINILPLPALDGGRIFFLLIEKVKGTPVKKEIEAIIHSIGFYLLIALILFITYRDIIKLF